MAPLPLSEGWESCPPKKNWAYMIRVAAHLTAGGSDIQWVLIGDGPERPALERLVREKGLADRFRFMGFQPQAARFIRDFDALFFPSLMEGTPGVVREAMVLGVPVVAVNAPGTVETLGGHGWVVNDGDENQAAQAVLQVLSDSALRQRRCDRARRFALDRFSIDRTISGTLAVYQTLLV